MHRAGALAAALVITGLAWGPAPARADFTPVGPFLGDGWESFEFVGNQGSYPTLDLFGGGAAVSNSFGAGVIVASSLYNFPNDIELTAYNGNYFLGSPVAQMRVDFDFPIHAVGVHISNAGPGFQTSDTSMVGAAEFFDAGGASLGTADPIEVTFGEWTWYGWTSDEPFRGVAFSAGAFPGEIVAIDDLVYSLTPVPEPSALTAAGAGALLLLRRRRRCA